MEEIVYINSKEKQLEGVLSLPEKPCGVVLFAHGSGSSRFSPRNMFVAKHIQTRGLGTLLIDLLTKEEDTEYEIRFNIPLLTERLVDAIHFLQNNEKTKALPIGIFGASTGAAAALEAAAILGKNVCSVVSRGGRPDLAANALPSVVSPTLLIVGGADFHVIEWNQLAFQRLQCEKRIEIVSGATHLFEEPGCLEAVATLAAEWFILHCIPKQIQESV